MLLANSKREFAAVTGPLGGSLGKSACAKPKDKEPGKGTSDYLTSVGLIKRYVLLRLFFSISSSYSCVDGLG